MKMPTGRSRLLLWACLAFKATAASKKNFEAYERWLTEEKGYTFGSVSVIEDDDGYRRVIATEAIKENFLLLKLPLESAFTGDRAQLTLAGFECVNDTAEVLEAVDGRTKLVLAVMQEQQDADSKWRPWLDYYLQDKDKHLPITWKKQEVQLLRGSGLQLEVTKEQDMYDEQYKALTEECPEFPNKVSLQEFMRISALVTSHGSGEDVLLPYVDMVNHETKPNAELGAAEDEGVYALVSLRDIRPGEEISVSYVNEEQRGLPMFPRYGFTDEQSTRGIVLFPACIPPSLAEILDEKQQDGIDLEGFSPELNSCCKDTNANEDKFCFATRIRNPTISSCFPFAVGPILPDGKEDSPGDLPEILHRIRTLVSDSGFTHKCSREAVDPEKPISMASEVLVMRLFKTLLAAHLGETSWAHVAGGTPPPPADSASEASIDLARKAIVIERDVFNWYVAAADYVEESLVTVIGTEALQQKLCENFMWHKARPKAKPQGMSKFVWFVENVLAPLAFRQNVENGEPCGLKQASYKLKSKECKGILKRKKEHEEL